ncbi:MAG: hypothetical protein EBX37_18795 [Alphaproteobacteria bacterium]|nr:hypothetical protein [Alphaproteobacteria bacterium]
MEYWILILSLKSQTSHHLHFQKHSKDRLHPLKEKNFLIGVLKEEMVKAMEQMKPSLETG